MTLYSVFESFQLLCFLLFFPAFIHAMPSATFFQSVALLFVSSSTISLFLQCESFSVGGIVLGFVSREDLVRFRFLVS